MIIYDEVKKVSNNVKILSFRLGRNLSSGTLGRTQVEKNDSRQAGMTI
jgi:hypothetical protein